MENLQTQNPKTEKGIENLQIQKFIENIENKKDQIFELLTDYESLTTAKHELWLTLDCLKNIGLEKQYLAGPKVEKTAVFLPLNLPLYSLATFCVIPSLVSERVIFRPPALLKDLFGKLTNLLELDNLFESIKTNSLSRNWFVKEVATTSDVVIFTGQYENALEIKDQCPSSLFIYSGAPIDPILLYENADLDLAVEKIIQARTFDSGQDCAGPDAVLVPEKIASQFLAKLIPEVTKIKIGDYKDPEVQVGRLISNNTLKAAAKEIEEQKDNIIFGGKIDRLKNIVYPTVIARKLNEHRNYQEFFCPIFYISTYRDSADLKTYFNDQRYKDYAMYVPIFGSSTDEVDIPNSVTLRNQTLLDFAGGNYPYGGFGYKANFINYKDQLVARPILISKEIRSWKNNGIIQE